MIPVKSETRLKIGRQVDIRFIMLLEVLIFSNIKALGGKVEVENFLLFNGFC